MKGRGIFRAPVAGLHGGLIDPEKFNSHEKGDALGDKDHRCKNDSGLTVSGDQKNNEHGCQGYNDNNCVKMQGYAEVIEKTCPPEAAVYFSHEAVSLEAVEKKYRPGEQGKGDKKGQGRQVSFCQRFEYIS